MTSKNSFGSRATLTVDGRRTRSIACPPSTSSPAAAPRKLPFSLKILLENLLRNEDDAFVKRADIEAMATWDVDAARPRRRSRSARAACCCRTSPACPPSSISPPCATRSRRSAAIRSGSTRCSRSISSSTTRCRSTNTASQAAFLINTELEFERNQERYVFLRWGQDAFKNFRVVPPGTGICHQVNLEYLGKTVFVTRRERRRSRVSRLARRHRLAHDDDQRPRRARLGRRRHRSRGGDARPAGVDAHSGSRRLQAARQAAAGRDGDGSRAHRAPRCFARRKSSASSSSSTGPGSQSLPLADRATIANMAPEYGATMGFFPVDDGNAQVPATHAAAASIT